MKKIVIRVILVIVILFLMSRVYHFVVINKVHKAIENFENETNRAYSVTVKMQEDMFKKEIYFKDNVMKRLDKREGTYNYCEWRNFENGDEYAINLISKHFVQDDILNIQYNTYLPSIIVDIYKNNKFNISEFLKIKYIIPTTYENRKCYKIFSNGKIFIVSKDTYLPMYFSLKQISTDKNSQNLIENIYEYKVGEVTDEDVLLPDLTGFTDVSENKK